MRADPQGIHEFQNQATFVIQRVLNIFFQGSKAAGLPELRLTQLGAQCQAGTDGEDLGGYAKQGTRIFADESDHLVKLLTALEQVNLVQHDEHFFTPITQLFKEGTLALGEGTVGGGDEQHQDGAGDELLGDV